MNPGRRISLPFAGVVCVVLATTFLTLPPAAPAADRSEADAVVRAGASGQWLARESTGLARGEVAMARVGRFAYLGWGGTLLERYNFRRDVWVPLGDLPAVLNHIQAVVLDRRIYWIGGLVMQPGRPKPASDSVWVYDPASGSIDSGAPMPEGRERGAGGVAVHDGLIYYVGGLIAEPISGENIAVPWVDVYDPIADEWTSLPDMPRARDHFQAVVVDDMLWAIGGRTGMAQTPFGYVDALDLSTGDWTSGYAELPTPRGGYAVALLGDEILVIGGEGNGKAYRKVEAYDPVGNTWRTLAPMRSRRHGFQAVVRGGRVYVADGGMRQGGGLATDTTEVFVPD
ncbi:MAG: kelch repeat-containing protein [Actinomycetota bacterium]